MTDRWAATVYLIEERELAPLAPVLPSRAAVVDLIDHVIGDPWWETCFPDAPVDVRLEDRSRSAAWALADLRAGVVALPIGVRRTDVILHELAHLAAGEPDHGAPFCTALLLLVRRHLGFMAYGALRAGFDRVGVPYTTAALL